MFPARNASLLAVTIVGSWLSASSASASQAPPAAQQVETPRVDVALVLSINGTPDVNKRPHCIELSLPCSPGDISPKSSPELGIALSISRKMTSWAAVVGELATYGNQWADWDASHEPAIQWNRVRSVLVGPRFTTRFFALGNDPAARLFAHALTGIEASSVAPARRAIQIGGGLDVMAVSRRNRLHPQRRNLMVRMGFDYRSTPGEERNLSGFRFSMGVVWGPRWRE